MEVRDLKTGARLELEILGNNGDRIGNIYISQVLEPVKDSNLVIAAPIFESRLIYVPVNSKVRITLYHKRYGLLGFIAIVTSREQRGNLSVICIQAETQLEKIQRRRYYRLDCTLNVEYSIYLDNITQEIDQPPYRKALTKNISGAGASMVVGEEIMKNTLLKIRISLSETSKVSAICNVLRCVPLEFSQVPKYELGLYFTDITYQNQDKIIKYIFEQQRRLLKNDVPQ